MKHHKRQKYRQCAVIPSQPFARIVLSVTNLAALSNMPMAHSPPGPRFCSKAEAVMGHCASGSKGPLTNQPRRPKVYVWLQAEKKKRNLHWHNAIYNEHIEIPFVRQTTLSSYIQADITQKINMFHISIEKWQPRKPNSSAPVLKYKPLLKLCNK